MDICSNCGSTAGGSEEKCLTCGEYLGAPNVRAANEHSERLALEQRYQVALERAELRNAKISGSVGVVRLPRHFDNAVINVPGQEFEVNLGGIKGTT
jgi:hypothetical protein